MKTYKNDTPCLQRDDVLLVTCGDVRWLCTFDILLLQTVGVLCNRLSGRRPEIVLVFFNHVGSRSLRSTVPWSTSYAGPSRPASAGPRIHYNFLKPGQHGQLFGHDLANPATRTACMSLVIGHGFPKTQH